ncbi:fibrillin-1-like [Cotesia glomerata]|uniref:fibrillin-1-like n=1 Tax=Cotesia glomerata TaxID=32391 RepID=UPI001D01762D|nr:fibrillin-1-like [Cotesia glomerata]
MQFNVDSRSCLEISKSVEKSCSNYQFMRDGQCVGGLYASCNTTNDCSAENTYCDMKSRTCWCHRGYLPYTLEKCQLGIGKDCNQSKECSVKNSVCDGSKCACPNNHYLSANERSCIPLPEKVMGSCQTKKGCQLIPNTYCSVESVCQCMPGFLQINDKCVSTIGGLCTEHSDCPDLNSECMGHECRCKQHYYPSFTNKTVCLPVALVAGGHCESDEGCVMNHTICEENKCVCKSGYRNYNGECHDPKQYCVMSIRDCSPRIKDSVCRNHKCICNTHHYLTSNGKACLRNARNLKDRCDNDNGCQELPYSICRKKKCVCDDKHVTINKQCKAILEVKCKNDGDCGVDHSICDRNQNVCKCKQNYYAKPDNKQCFKFSENVNENCKSDTDCSVIKNTECSKNHKCECKPGFFNSGNQCQRLIDTDCSDDSNCMIGNSTCNPQVRTCQCNDGYYSSRNGTECNPFAKDPKDWCEDNRGCFKVQYSECLLSKCTCIKNYVLVGGKCKALVGEICVNEFDCGVSNSKCESHICKCKADYYSSIDKSQCYPLAKESEDFCEDNRGCRNVMHSSCSNNNTCKCNDNYQLKGKECLGLANAECLEADECLMSNSTCTSRTCQCRKGYYLADKITCYKYAEELYDHCEDEHGCCSIDNAECTSNKCVCKSDFFEENKQCKRLIGTECLLNSDCTIENSTCKGCSCECANGFYHSLNRKQCLALATNLGSTCEDNRGCQRLKYTECSSNKTCNCKSNFIKVNEKCRSIYGEECDSELDCATKGSKCESRTCECKSGDYLSADKSQCYIKATELNKFCGDNRGCRSIKYSRCSSKNTCECKDDYQQKGHLCLGKIDADCSNSTECGAKDAICSADNTCQCPLNYYFENGNCHKYAAKLEEECYSMEACDHLPYAQCGSSGKCECRDNYDNSTGVCRGLINAICENSTDCAAKDAICSTDKNCQCPSNYYLKNDNCHKHAAKLEEECYSMEACDHLPYAQCGSSGKCECRDNYDNSTGVCRGLINAICENSTDCAAKDAICSTDKNCQCPSNYYLKNDNCHKHAAKLEEECYSMEACDHLPYAQCGSSGKCECRDNYDNSTGVCRGLINAICENSTDCAVKDAICSTDKTCQCHINYYAENNNCRKYTAKLEEDCDSTRACDQLPYAQCSSSGKCECRDNYDNSTGVCRGLINAICENSTDCAAKDAICSTDKTCQCPSNYYFENDNCHKHAVKLEEECYSMEACDHLPYAQCGSSGKCECRDNYDNSTGVCRGLINAICENSTDCAAKDAICSTEKTCQCPSNYYFENDNCHKYAAKLEEDCDSAKACDHLPYAQCSSSGKCECWDNYDNSTGVCRGLINAICENSTDCAAKGAICSTEKTCQCPSNYYFENDNCHKYAVKLEEDCDSTKACDHLPFAQCSSSGKCECWDNYDNSTGVCRGLINEICDNSTDCVVERAMDSTEKTCQCPINYYAENNTCLKYATSE